jgi:intein/homing endonuclease
LAAPEREVGYGGPLTEDTIVITSRGRVKLGEVNIGDKVLTPKGTFSEVIDIPFVGDEESFLIKFSNGAEVVASAGHKWCLSTNDWSKTNRKWRTRTTLQIAKTYACEYRHHTYRVPSVVPFDHAPVIHYISPYLLGVLIADGCIIRGAEIYTADDDVVDRCRQELDEEYELIHYKDTVRYRIVKKAREKHAPSKVNNELRRLNLFGKNSFTKFIPKEYLYDSIENRLALLRGLMDSDGTVRSTQDNRRSAECKYTTVSAQLASDFVFLAESLGFHTRTNTEIMFNGNTTYRIYITQGIDVPFHLSRKVDRYKAFNIRRKSVMVKSIEPVGVKRVRCITIADEDHLFVLQRNIVTHNSAGSGKSYALLADPLRYISHPSFSGLILRHTTEELRELVWKSQELYPRVIPGIKWSERKMQWETPRGGRLWMSYLDADQDVLRYQGLSFCVAKNTPVLMADGSYKAVQDIKPGDFVATMEGPARVSFRSQPLLKKSVALHLYSVEGRRVFSQIQPYSHPIALLSSEPLKSLSDQCHNDEKFLKSPIQWRSYTQLQSDYSKIPDFVSLREDDQIDCEAFEHNNLKSGQPQKLFYPVVLHAQSFHQALDRASTRYCTFCKSSARLLTTNKDFSKTYLGQRQPDELPQSLVDRNMPHFCQSSDDDVNAQLDSETTLSLKYHYSTYCCQCGEQLPFEKEFSQCDVRKRVDVEKPFLYCQHDGDTDCIPSHSRYQLSAYIHPYTKELRHLKDPAELGFVQFEPLINPYVEVYDLTIETVNHYITFGGIINQNCWVGFDELTQWGTPFAWNYMRSRLRSTSPDLPLYMRFTTNPGNKGHCVPFGEVLTENGWVDIKNISVGDKVLTMNTDFQMFYTPVEDVVKEKYDGTMIHRKDEMIFTENHRLPMLTKKGFGIRPFTELPGQANIIRAGAVCKDLLFNDDFIVPSYKGRKTKLQQPSRISNADYCEMMGWYLSEGYVLDRDKEFGISQVKEQHRLSIRNLLTRCGFQYRESKTGFQISSPSWWNYLKRFGKSRDKFVPKEIKQSVNLNKFFAAAMSGDGHWKKEGVSGCYYTISKQLADDMVEIAVLLGYTVSVRSRQRDNRVGLSYEVSVSKIRSQTEINTGNHIYNVNTTNSKCNVEKRHFNGIVYCLTVPKTEVFFIRQNGYVWLSGNTWVKKMFIDPSPVGKPFWATDIDTGQVMTYPKGHSKEGQPLFKRRFIPAKLSDNPFLYESGDYEANLLSLPENQRRQLLDGDWDIAEGAAFPEFQRSIHVIEPHSVPNDWPKFRACDYGYGSHSCVLWMAVAPDESIIVYRELYVKGVLAEDLAEMVLKAEQGERILYGVLDSSTWHKRGDTGPSIAERMIVRGCRWRPSDRSAGSRVAGKNEIHRRLQIDSFTGKPRIFFFNNCTQIIADLPTIPLDKKNPEDIDTNVSNDHSYDALRYGLMSRPRSRSIFDHDESQHGGIIISDPTFGY